MTSSSRRRGLAFGLIGALALAAPATAGPVVTGSAGLKAAAQDNVVDVRWRHRGGAGLAAGLAFGALAGAAIGAATAPRYYGYPASYGYGYDYPAYSGYYPAYSGYAYTYPAYDAYAYQTAPVVYGSGFGYYGSSYAYPYQTCGVYAGYNRWDYSQC
jgi:hypothetical protein